MKLGAFYNKFGNVVEATKLYQIAVNINDQNIECLINLAQLIVEDDSVKAKELCKKIIEIDPNYYQAYHFFIIRFQQFFRRTPF